MSERIKINVGGRTFEVYTETLLRFPETMLGRYVKAWKDKSENEDIFFDRNATLFEFILDFYRNGCHSFPQNLSPEDYNKELDFWGLPRVEVEEEKPKELRGIASIIYPERILDYQLLFGRDGVVHDSFGEDGVIQFLLQRGSTGLPIRQDNSIYLPSYLGDRLSKYNVDQWKRIILYFFRDVKFTRFSLGDPGAPTQGGHYPFRLENFYDPNSYRCQLLQIDVVGYSKMEPWFHDN